MYNPERYRKGAPTVLDALYPFVGKTKYGYKILIGEIAQRLKTMMQEICARYEMSIKQGNMRAAPVHILISASSDLSIAKSAQILKGRSSYIRQREFPELPRRYGGQHLGARGAFCSTVGGVTEEMIKRYIAKQESDDTFKV